MPGVTAQSEASRATASSCLLCSLVRPRHPGTEVVRGEETFSRGAVREGVPVSQSAVARIWS